MVRQSCELARWHTIFVCARYRCTTYLVLETYGTRQVILGHIFQILGALGGWSFAKSSALRIVLTSARFCSVMRRAIADVLIRVLVVHLHLKTTFGLPWKCPGSAKVFMFLNCTPRLSHKQLPLRVSAPFGIVSLDLAGARSSSKHSIGIGEEIDLWA